MMIVLSRSVTDFTNLIWCWPVNKCNNSMIPSPNNHVFLSTALAGGGVCFQGGRCDGVVKEVGGKKNILKKTCCSGGGKSWASVQGTCHSCTDGVPILRNPECTYSETGIHNSLNMKGRHEVETLSSLLALSGGILPITSGWQKAGDAEFCVSFIDSLNMLLNKRLICRWFETP